MSLLSRRVHNFRPRGDWQQGRSFPVTDDQRRAALREDVLSLLSMVRGEPSWREFEQAQAHLARQAS